MPKVRPATVPFSAWLQVHKAHPCGACCSYVKRSSEIARTSPVRRFLLLVRSGTRRTSMWGLACGRRRSRRSQPPSPPATAQCRSGRAPVAVRHMQPAAGAHLAFRDSRRLTTEQGCHLGSWSPHLETATNCRLPSLTRLRQGPQGRYSSRPLRSRVVDVGRCLPDRTPRPRVPAGVPTGGLYRVFRSLG